jgi:hypothetical protein
MWEGGTQKVYLQEASEHAKKLSFYKVVEKLKMKAHKKK